MAYLNLIINQVKLALHKSRDGEDSERIFGEFFGTSTDTPVTLSGLIGRGTATRYSVDNRDFYYDDATWVIGRLRVGAKVVMRGVKRKDGSPYARSIVVKN